ncbi:hypothetical protein E2C01_023408 [Portunus trituberculatus]|uniref:Uncharacterized protein n=1 Tax=Portunus trituberculatus TaxID=210409 RepID=A0A5B7E9Q6_PORTR|nr:hypothetical protein [Portunus trituberculatus]
MDLGPASRRCSGTVIGRRGEDGTTPHRLPHYGHIFPRDRFGAGAADDGGRQAGHLTHHRRTTRQTPARRAAAGSVDENTSKDYGNKNGSDKNEQNFTKGIYEHTSLLSHRKLQKKAHKGSK